MDGTFTEMVPNNMLKERNNRAVQKRFYAQL